MPIERTERSISRQDAAGVLFVDGAKQSFGDSFPVSPPHAGWRHYRSDTGHWYYWDGSGWVRLLSSAWGPPAYMGYAGGTQSSSATTYIGLSLTTDVHKDDGFTHSTSVNNSEVTLDYDGLIRCSFKFEGLTTAGGSSTAFMRMELNPLGAGSFGAITGGRVKTVPVPASSTFTGTVSDLLFEVNAGDVVRLAFRKGITVSGTPVVQNQSNNAYLSLFYQELAA